MNKCTTCHRHMIAGRQWEKLTKEQRTANRAKGITVADSHGLCGRCRTRQRRGVSKRATVVPSSVVVEEWNWLANPTRPDQDNIRDLAPRLGMTYAGLEQAVFMARKRGLVPPARCVA
jgi:hypothetical protein